ncbi:MAG: flagellar biosynthesis protein FlhA [Bryobacter sp.]|nr:flagellar biosynthesis protein FlhA [Bryobacter sp.]
MAVLGILAALILPIPAWLLDLLIAVNIALSTVVLSTALYLKKITEFSIFPSTLLILTLFRLALNVSSSRLILLNGNLGTAAAGDIIEAFGEFVVGGNAVIGLVIFIVLIAIQYIVINHGAVRISEVSARFTLDALPGKQMSIDADLNAGLIDETEAKRRRKAVTQEAEFFGAMDGASRFTQRDSVAGILILVINIGAGFLIGVVQHKMEILTALQTYTVLTIGDGLVTVIPALMISIAGALIVTRAASEDKLDREVRKQLFAHPEVLGLAGFLLALLGLVPGLPKIPFFVLSAACAYIAYRQKQAATQQEAEPIAEPVRPAKEDLEQLLKVEPLTLEVGLGLVRFVEGGESSPLLQRIAGLRRQLAMDLGYVFPAVRITDNLRLGANEYRILIKNNEVARYELQRGMDLLLPPGAPDSAQNRDLIQSFLATGAIATTEPSFQMEACWIPSQEADRARTLGCTLVDALGVLSTHFSEVLKRHLHEVFSRADAKKFLDRLADENPKAVEELVPKLLSLSIVQKILQNLLREGVSIRDAGSILESLSEGAAMTKNPILLTEFVRQALKRTVVRPLLQGSSTLPVWQLEPALEQEFEASVEHAEFNSHITVGPARMRDLLNRLTTKLGSASGATLVTGSNARFFVRQITEQRFPHLKVLSHAEIPTSVQLVSLGQV